MNKIFPVVLGAAMLASGASLASDLSDYAFVPSGHAAPMTRMAANAQMGGKMGAMAKADGWTVDIVDAAMQGGRHMPAANRDTDPGAVDRELAANPGLATKLKEMRIEPASVQAIAVRDLGTGTEAATVFVR